MKDKIGFFQSTIGRKQIVALAGLGFALFVAGHMAGNLFMFVSPQAYNEYGHAIISNKAIYIIEMVLAAMFLGHAAVAIRLHFLNRSARPQRYAVEAKGYKATNTASKTMAIQGSIILAFVISHLMTFKFGPHYEVDYGNGPIRDLFRLVVEVFQSPGYVFWYCLSMVIIGLHLSHGIKSVVQTFGLHHPKYQCHIKVASVVYAVLVAGGFLSQPLFMFFFYKG